MVKTALITGISGFTGSHLARTLVKADWKVIGIVRSDSKLDQINDIRNNIKLYVYSGNGQELIEIMQQHSIDVVFHLAALVLVEHTVEQVPQLIDASITFGCYLAEAMCKTNVKHMVTTGTSWQHYKNESYHPVNLYAAFKEAFYVILKYYHEAYGLSVINLELYDVYGPKDKRKKIIPLLKNYAETGEKLLMSPGEQSIDLVYITDIVAAYLTAYEWMSSQSNACYKAYAITSGRFLKLKEVVAIFEKTLGGK